MTAPQPRHIRDLRSTGLLWLINRVVFHPRGYALALVFEEGVVDGAFLGWELLGTGTDVWRMTEEMDDRGFANAQQFLDENAGGRRIGHVATAGGGHVDVYVDRDLSSYPAPGSVAYVLEPAQSAQPADQEHHAQVDIERATFPPASHDQRPEPPPAAVAHDAGFVVTPVTGGWATDSADILRPTPSEITASYLRWRRRRRTRVVEWIRSHRHGR